MEKHASYTSADLRKGPDIPELESWTSDMGEFYNKLVSASKTLKMFDEIVKGLNKKYQMQE